MDSAAGEKVLVFFKTTPDVITPSNLDSILVSSLVESPITSLYHALQTLYAPVLLEVFSPPSLLSTTHCKRSTRLSC